jgi:hypothetical protein
LYSSKPCLKEIYAAQKSKIEIIPLRFEVDLPPIDKQWPQIKPTDMDGILMLTEVQKEYCLLEATPKYPKTMLSDPHMLDELVADVKNRLADPEHFQKRKQKLAQQAQAPSSGNPIGNLGVQPRIGGFSGDDDWGHGGGVAEPWKLTNLLADGASSALNENDPLLDGSQAPLQRAAKFRKEKRGENEAKGFQMDFTTAVVQAPSMSDKFPSKSSAQSEGGGRQLQRKRPKAAGGGGGAGTSPGGLQKNQSQHSEPGHSARRASAKERTQVVSALGKSSSVPERKRPKAPPPPPSGGQDF